MRLNFKELSEKDVILFLAKMDHKSYRARQIINWIYRKMAASFNEMTDLPQDLRRELNESAFISSLNVLQKQISRDGTQKFLFEMQDGETIESVLIPNTRGKFTLCISSQAGCSLGCRFCNTGRKGFRRNLKSYEIVDQVITVNRFIAQNQIVIKRCKNSSSEKKDLNREDARVTNIVFMGMGEPLNNIHEVADALWKITDLIGFSRRKITVSTAGISSKIPVFLSMAPDINLAVSLNATTDNVRSRIMPVNMKYPLKQLINTCREISLPPHRRLTFEYVLFDRINNSKDDAKRLIRLLKGIRAKVNLIPFNPFNQDDHAGVLKEYGEKGHHMLSEIRFKKPSHDNILEFQNILLKAGIVALIRKSKGSDIAAACGQLKAG